jgi:glycosyltransferase involved in cell wall biosynthesis
MHITCFSESAKRGEGTTQSAVLTANAAIELGYKADLVLHRAVGASLDQLRPEVNVIALDGEPSLRALRQMRSAGDASLVFSTLRRTTLLRDPAKWVYWSIPALWSYLRRTQPDILVSFGMKPGSMNGMLARLRPSTATIHAAAMSIQPSVWLGQRHRRKADLVQHYRYCDLIFGCSEGVSRDTERVLDLAPQSVATLFEPVIEKPKVPDGPPTHPWLADGIPGQRDRPVIVSAGRLVVRKDYATLIRAFARLRQDRPARLVIFGRGDLRDSLAALARSLGVGEDVDLPGEYPDLVREFSGAELFAFASRGEGLGKVIVEALAAGLPVACTDCPSGPREILEDGRFGTLVPVGDVSGLAAAMAAELDGRRPAKNQRNRAKIFSSLEFARQLFALALAAAGSEPRGIANKTAELAQC